MHIPIQSTYAKVATSFTVMDIATRLAHGAPHSLAWEARVEVEVDEPVHPEYALVRDESRIYGYASHDSSSEAQEQETLEDVAIPIGHDELISASTPLLELPRLFEKQYWLRKPGGDPAAESRWHYGRNSYFFILNRDDITHIVTFVDLDKLPMQLCIFSLLTELELALLGVLLRGRSAIHSRINLLDEPASPYLQYLSDSGRHKAEELSARKSSKLPAFEYGYFDVLACTTLKDKVRMFKAAPDLLRKLHPSIQPTVARVLDLAAEVRNEVAHGGSILLHLNTPALFASFVHELRVAINSIKNWASSRPVPPLD